MTGKIWGGGMKKREECVGKNETRKDVRRKGGRGGETRGCHSTLHSDHKDHKKP